MDKRRFRRLYKTLPMDYEASAQGANGPAQGRGVLKDISLGGVYFMCQDVLNLALGHFLKFTITCRKTPPHCSDMSLFQGHGSVVRIEPPRQHSPFFGVAVEFLKPLSLSSLIRRVS
jgi:c-di-GMP-binding flagellar brake protein YcgR